jgi:alkanesulfonate monooxygenase SsuD/methylene tetrahydromethanopterin reductase-like flavin-dependent oxidoreductase (luciferase family)
MHGEPFDHPAPRMADIITIIRALWGEDFPGVERHANGTMSYTGRYVSVQQTSVDVRPERRVPILLAAAGPHMLRVAGALCDGVILERASLKYLDWAREQLEIGARRTGRSLDGFEICLQGSFLIERPGEIESRSVQAAISSHIDYCTYPEWDATHEVMGLGDAVRSVRAALEAGHTAKAREIVAERFLPEIGVPLGAATMPAFFGWVEEVRRRGVTILPLPLELEELTAWKPAALRERILAGNVATEPAPGG